MTSIDSNVSNNINNNSFIAASLTSSSNMPNVVVQLDQTSVNCHSTSSKRFKLDQFNIMNNSNNTNNNVYHMHKLQQQHNQPNVISCANPNLKKLYIVSSLILFILKKVKKKFRSFTYKLN